MPFAEFFFVALKSSRQSLVIEKGKNLDNPRTRDTTAFHLVIAVILSGIKYLLRLPIQGQRHTVALVAKK
jgi:hypothetical protein